MNLWARFVIFSLLFGCFPVGLGGGLLYYSLQLEEESRKNEFKQSLDRDAGAVLRRTDPKAYLQVKLGRFAREVFRGSNPPRRLEVLRQRILPPATDLAFDPLLFDGSGKLITPETIPLKNKFVLQKVYDFLVSPPLESAKILQAHRKKVAALFGSEFQLGVLKTREQQVSFFRVGGVDGAILWKRASREDASGIMLVAWRIPTREFLLEKYAKTELSFLWLMGAMPGAAVKCYGRPMSATFDDAQQAFSKARSGYLWQKAFLWKNAFAEQMSLFIGKSVDQPGNAGANLRKTSAWRAFGGDVFLGGQRRWLLAITGFLMLVAVFLWHRRFFAADHLYVSIRFKLVALFLLTMGTPLMGVAFLGSQTLQDRQNILTTQAIKEAKDRLFTLDADFSHETVDFGALCRELRDDPDFRQKPQKLKDKTDRLQAEHRILHFEARSWTGEILVKTYITGFFEGMEEFFDSFGKSCIMRNLADRLLESGMKISRPPDQAIVSLLESPYLPLLHILTRRDVVHQTQLGTNIFFWYWDIISDTKQPVAYLTVLQSLDSAFRLFLARRIMTLKEQEGRDFQILAREDASGRWFPAGVRIPGALDMLMDRVRIGQEMILERLEIRGASYLAMGFPGKTLQGIGLLALFPEDKILRKIRTLRQSIFLGILLTLVFSVLVGAVLSTTFLRPLGELSMGMSALQAHDTKYRVRLWQNDELGALGQAFNRMMEDLKEMALAAVVQESLIPQVLPPLPGYEVKLGNIPASRLGGDYCDVIPLSNGAYLFVIGDVTGHGVGAALLMAMVKAAVFDFVETSPDLLGLMDHLNRMVLQFMNRTMLMTFAALLLEPETGRFQYANAGHPFPFRCRANGEVGEMELHHLPLGIKDRRESFKILESVLLTGETIVMFSDGYYESTNPAGEMYSYERMGELVRTVASLPAAGIYQKMTEDLRRFRVYTTLEDDCTMLILKRIGHPR